MKKVLEVALAEIVFTPRDVFQIGENEGAVIRNISTEPGYGSVRSITRYDEKCRFDPVTIGVYEPDKEGVDFLPRLDDGTRRRIQDLPGDLTALSWIWRLMVKAGKGEDVGLETVGRNLFPISWDNGWSMAYITLTWFNGWGVMAGHQLRGVRRVFVYEH